MGIQGLTKTLADQVGIPCFRLFAGLHSACFACCGSKPTCWLTYDIGFNTLLQAPDCVKEQKFENFFGRKIAVDASMHIYQFMVVVSEDERAQ
jgi:hypothetical protein